VQRNLMADGEGISQWHNITPDQRMMCVLPIHHVNGTIVTHVTPFLAGSSVVLNRKFQTEYFFQRIKDENVHVVSVVPTLLAFLLEAKQDSLGVQQQGFRNIICGAGPLTCELARQFEDTYNIPIMHGYGLSETTCYSCFLETSLTEIQHRKWLLDYGFPSIGTPIPQNEMQIHDTNGNPLGEHERGEIVIRGWNVMKEYYQNDKANLETFQHSWFRSGDEGFWVNSPDGKPYFFITGRIKELFIRGGVNIAPLEIDEVINCAPGVKAGISVGFVNDFYGEEVGALVIPELNATQEEILAYCQKQLPFSKAPKVVLFTEQLPVTSTGKYQRNKVKHLFAEWQSHQFRKSK
ncbi:MAG: long-chain fatty acid--CoA ligase, partial [Candidatus Kapabacteria bacterium]|nr:long-chain fatty acid--CoA ligase [Candidatus Kapabacteria bacterium]